MKKAYSTMTSLKNYKILSGIAIITAFLNLFPFSLLAFAMPSDTQAIPINKSARTITVETDGSVSVKPDIALLQISVFHEAGTAKNAAAETEAAVQTIFAALKKQGIDGKDIQVEGLKVDTVSSWRNSENASEGIIRAGTVLHVTIRDTRKLQHVINEASANGATGFNNIAWANSDPESLYNAARQRALNNLLERTKNDAQKAGLSTGRILEITDNYENYGDLTVTGEITYSVSIILTQELVDKGP